MKKIIYLTLLCLTFALTASSQKYLGGDISMYPRYQSAGSKYYTNTGTAISDPLQYFKEQGMNMMRVRLFVDPSKATSDEQSWGAIQDIDFVKKLGKQIKDAGFQLLLDFHYSDTWADPSNQWTPDAWKSMTDAELCTQIYTYTKETLEAMTAYGAQPDAIQIGNEISYGMLWCPVGGTAKKAYSGTETNWQRFADLLNQASKACREVTPQAQVVVHTELIRNLSILRNFYSQMKAYNVDYDVVGLSYYPPYHGTITSGLRSSLNWLQTNISDKKIWIVEFAYPAQWALPGTTTYDQTATYPYTDAGQAKMVTDVITELNAHSNVTGLFWWWPEANEYGNSGSQITSSWWNGTLFNNQNGRAFSAITKLQAFRPEFTGIHNLTSDASSAEGNHAIYTLDGRKVNSQSVNGSLPKGIYVQNGKKVIRK